MLKNKKVEVDNHKLMYHPERVAEWKKRGDCFPIYVEIGPTNRCNHKCIFCALEWIEGGRSDINSKILCSNLEDMAQNGVKSVMFAGEGEPFLHKDISLFVKRAKEWGMDISITSNGILFNSKKAEQTLPYLSWIRFSIDAGTSETYSEIHGTRKEDFDKVMNNIEYAVKIKEKNKYPVTIGVQALLTKPILNELEILTKKLKEIGADNLQIKPYSHHPSSKKDLIFDYKESEKAREKLESIATDKFQIVYRTKTIERLKKERSYKECHGLPFFALIDAYGNVLPCGLFYNNSDFVYGNINESKFSDIWNSKRRKQVIKRIDKLGIENCRKGCRLDAVNNYLNRIKKPHPHDKFI